MTSGNPTRENQTANPSKYPQEYFKQKKCRLCGELFSPAAPSQHYCSQECMDWIASENYLQRTYCMSFCKFIELYEKQSGRCEICGKHGFYLNTNAVTRLVVDHCHKTHKVRGLLCHNCNRALGLLQDDILTIKNAAEYLEKCNDYSERK